MPTVPSLPSGVRVSDLIGDAISIAIVGFAVSVSLAKIFASKNDYEIDANQVGLIGNNLTFQTCHCSF